MQHTPHHHHHPPFPILPPPPAPAFLDPVGIPLLLLLQLQRLKRQLQPLAEVGQPDLTEKEQITKRNLNQGLKNAPLSSFAIHYRPKFWWYEVFSLFRRLVLTSVPLMFSTLDSVTVFVLIFGIIFLIVERECSPFVDERVSMYAYTSSWLLLVFVMYTMILDTDMSADAGATTISVFIFLTMVALMVLVFLDKDTVDKILNPVYTFNDRSSLVMLGGKDGMGAIKSKGSANVIDDSGVEMHGIFRAQADEGAVKRGTSAANPMFSGTGAGEDLEEFVATQKRADMLRRATQDARSARQEAAKEGLTATGNEIEVEAEIVNPVRPKKSKVQFGAPAAKHRNFGDGAALWKKPGVSRSSDDEI